MVTQATGILCPKCGHEVRFRGGMATNIVLAAVRAQAGQYGVEIICDRCAHKFVFRWPTARPDSAGQSPVPPPHMPLAKESATEAKPPNGVQPDPPGKPRVD